MSSIYVTMCVSLFNWDAEVLLKNATRIYYTFINVLLCFHSNQLMFGGSVVPHRFPSGSDWWWSFQTTYIMETGWFIQTVLDVFLYLLTHRLVSPTDANENMDDQQMTEARGFGSNQFLQIIPVVFIHSRWITNYKRNRVFYQRYVG